MGNKKAVTAYKRLSKSFYSRQRQEVDNSCLKELTPVNFSNEVLLGKRKIKVKEAKKKNV